MSLADVQPDAMKEEFVHAVTVYLLTHWPLGNFNEILGM